MLIDELQTQGIKLRINGEMLAFECEEPITEQLLGVLKNNKQQLIAEILMTALVEVVDDDIFPLHRFKDEHTPKPIVTDLSWLHEMLSYTSNRIEMAAEYSRIYKLAFDSEPVAHKKDNVARNTANTWLRELNE